VILRTRQSGDEITLSGGTKSLKKLFIDRKIPASRRNRIPVLADDGGVLWVHGFGANLARIRESKSGIWIRIEEMTRQ
jgi:tRNA(Ile)-lysidine synthase